MARRRTNRTRDYQRSARLNELLREVIAEELEKIDDSELGLVSISAVQVDNELSKARVYLSTLEEENDLVLTRMKRHKGRLRKAIGSQARLRRVPELEFVIDPAITTGGRIDEILSQIEANQNRTTDDETQA
ncbi:MAG: 30S ribosome-binding factor RbfA [Acidimicrobiales bacterium]|jgi:ribosome-binding factor A|nr:30S ribosome-binding factor RbfA [Acidimicrobiales bacterium]MDP6298544.1 30S ribosome-binding factor RbfA [Acidimicrobiales bacterium]HJM27614.1 30S ribosome-binding factor RbfA [Acidimicrobiales bacterium]HJM97166.1 30S ribosome-binding factor RbfA [Acidimicrobiales bacterium]